MRYGKKRKTKAGVSRLDDRSLPVVAVLWLWRTAPAVGAAALLQEYLNSKQ